MTSAYATATSAYTAKTLVRMLQRLCVVSMLQRLWCACFKDYGAYASMTVVRMLQKL